MNVALVIAVWLALLLLIFVMAIWGVILVAKEIIETAKEIRLFHRKSKKEYQK